MRKDRTGFTFVELLIAMLIFSLVSISIYLSFNVGIRAWQKGEGSYRTRQEARYLLGMVSRELRCMVNSKAEAMIFSGGPDSISFCKAANGLFRVTYEFDGKEKAVYRTLKKYNEASSGDTGTKSRLTSGISSIKFLTSEISGIKFKYSYKRDNEIIWADSWKQDDKAPSLPFGVKIFLTYTPSGAAEPFEISQTVLIPTVATIKDEEAPNP